MRIKICRTIVLHIVLYRCEIMGRKQGEGCSRNEGTGDWKKLYDEGLHDLYSSPDILGLN